MNTHYENDEAIKTKSFEGCTTCYPCIFLSSGTNTVTPLIGGMSQQPKKPVVIIGTKIPKQTKPKTKVNSVRRPSRPRSPWFNPTPRLRPRTARYPNERSGRPIHKMWNYRQNSSKLGLPMRPQTAQIGQRRQGNHFSKDGKGTSDPKFDEKDYVFTNPQMILRVMQDRQQTRTGFKTLRLYRDPKAAGQRAHKCEVTKDSIRHGLSKQGFNVSEKVAGEVFLKIAGQGCGEALTGGQFLEKLRDSTNKISRFGSAKPMFTSRTRKGKHAVPVVERGTIVDQIRTKQRTEVPNYDTAANKIKGFSTAQVEKYKHIARNRARDNFVSQQNDERHIKRVEQLYRKKAKNHGAALGGAMARGDGRPVVQVRKKSPRTTIVIRDRNDKRSGRSSIMTHMFAQSGWDIGHEHGRHLAGYNDENAKH